jgi:hypothetical protein
VNPGRQEAPHAHAFIPGPAGPDGTSRFAYAAGGRAASPAVFPGRPRALRDQRVG